MLWLNWGTIKEIFNYPVVYKETKLDLKKILTKEKETLVKMPEVSLVPQDQEIKKSGTTKSYYSLNIPKINITAPLLFAAKEDRAYFQDLLKQGVVAYPTSALPGQEGVSIILGHSAPPGWPKIRYDWVFSNLNELQEDDIIYLSSGNKNYAYTVTKKFFLNRGQKIPIVRRNESSKSIVFLISCWPPGVDYKRIIIQAEL